MFRLRIEGHFSAAHRLPKFKGRDAVLHGHNWDVEIVYKASQLDEHGMVADYKEARKALKSVLKQLDHGYINTIFDKMGEKSTAENVAKWIAHQMKVFKVSKHAKFEKVVLREDRLSRVEYIMEEI